MGVFVDREDALDRGGPALAPADVLLVVEVVSPGNAGRDLVLKRHEYGVAGIPRYWLVEPRKQALTMLEHVGTGYREAGVLPATDVHRTDHPFPLVLPIADIF